MQVPRQLPNVITGIRIGLLPFFGLATFNGDRTGALVLLALIAGSDVLDGWLARRFRLATPLGAFLDPLADKLAQVTALTMLALDVHPAFTAIPVWFVALVFARELLLVYGAIRIRSRHKRVAILPSIWGKLSTALVFGMVFGALLGLGDRFMTVALAVGTPVVVASAVQYTLAGRRQYRTGRTA
jgi:cardiolipin synthase